MADAALQRKNMVESQVRPSDVTDRRITAAMAKIPRERFLPARLTAFAYSDETLNLGPGRVVLAPSTFARLLQLAEIDAKNNVLVIGGCGYAAAIVAEMAATAVALLPDGQAAANVSEIFSAIGTANVTVVNGELAAGWKAKAPYDVIVIEGGVEAVPA
jgi:protein-L-isoaspartate(D-aspartate) O-methyltransferase